MFLRANIYTIQSLSDVTISGHEQFPGMDRGLMNHCNLAKKSIENEPSAKGAFLIIAQLFMILNEAHSKGGNWSRLQ